MGMHRYPVDRGAIAEPSIERSGESVFHTFGGYPDEYRPSAHKRSSTLALHNFADALEIKWVGAATVVEKHLIPRLSSAV
jgi:hypothetical protein